MKNQFNKILKVLIVILFFSANKSYSIEGITELTDAINDAREEFNNVSEASTEESKIIDQAIKEMDKATEYVQAAINNDNAEDAIKTLEFIEKSLTDIESIIPQEFSSDMSKMDLSSIPKEDMDVVTELTTQMKTAKEQSLKDFMVDLVDLNQKGIDTVSISKNLNDLGVNTINLVLNLDTEKKIETWAKEDWSNAYTGSVLTAAGTEIVTDKEISNKVVDLEQKLQANAAAILDKRFTLTELQTKIDPLSPQITDLKNQKSDLLTKYNNEILKQASALLSDEESTKSKQLADQFEGQLSSFTNQIKTLEQQSDSFQQQIQDLNEELASEINNKAQLQDNIRNFNNQLSVNQNVLSKKTSEINQLKNTNIDTKLTELSNQLEAVTLQRDFVQKDIDKSLDKEVAAFQYYYSALGNVNAANYDIQAEYAVREVQAILNPDPKAYRAFELEKYSKLAGLPQEVIDEGLAAIQNDDWEKQKSITRQVYNALEKNPQAVLPDGWDFDKITDGDINVMITEDRAIQEAVYASIELNEIKGKVDLTINEKTKNLQNLINLNPTTIKYAATYEGMAEHQPLMNEINSLLQNNQDIALKQSQISELQKEIDGFKSNKDQAYQAYQQQIAQVNLDFQKLEQEITQHSALNGWGNKEWVDKYNQLRDQRVEIFYDRFATFEDPTFQNISKISNLNLELSTIKNNATAQARDNLLNSVLVAQKQFDQIVAEESKELTDYQNKISSILKEIPTFEKDADLVVDLSPVQLRAKLVDIASAGNLNEFNAVEKALKELDKLGQEPVSQFMTGPYWESSNVKTAAIVRSTKYGFVDNYDYINAYYKDPLTLQAAERAELKGELQEVLGQNNIVFNTLEAKVNNLSAELNLTKQQSQNLKTEISKLENELSSLKNSEKEIQNQLSNLSNQFNSKESLISEKNKSLASLQEQMSPLNTKMSELQSQRAEIDGKLNEQLNTIANQIQNQGQPTDEANALKAEFENQIAQLDSQLKNYENQSVEINSQLNSITTELNILESESPELANQIKSLNEDLNSFEDVKAGLAMTIARDIGLEVDEKSIKSIEILDGKVVIALKGTSLVRVVDEKMLIDQAVQFIDPVSKFSVNSKIYTPAALTPELITQTLATNTYAEAKEAREKAVERLNTVEKTPGASKEEIEAARTASDAAKYAEIAAGQSVATNTKIASSISKEASLQTLKDIAGTPGMNKWDVRRANTAVKAAEASLAGKNFDYQVAMNKIANEERAWNVSRLELYQKDLNELKATPGVTDKQIQIFQDDINRFQQRLVDERNAYEVATVKTNYYEALSTALTANNKSVSSAAIQQSARAVTTSNIQEATNSSTNVASVNTSAVTSAYDAAKSAREQIDQNLNELRAVSGGVTTDAIKAAETARHAALQAEIAAANVVAANSSALQAAAQEAAAAAQDVASSASSAAQAAAQEASQVAAQQAVVDALREVASTPGMSQWDVQRAQAAVRAAEAELSGADYSLERALSTIEQNKAYEEAGGEPNRSGRTWDGH